MVEAVVAVALRAILVSVVLGGALALAVFVAARTLALSAATRHALWTTALIAIGVMPLAGLGFSLAHATTAVAEPPAHGTISPRHTGVTTAPPSTHAHVRVPETHVAATMSPPPFTPRLDFRPHLTPTIALGLVAAWALGALIGLGSLIASVWRVRGLKHRSSPLDAALSDELPWLTEVGPGREIYLRLSYEAETPVAIGFRRPVILIPTELATADGLAAIEPLVLHEHAHLRRYDDWTNLAQRVIERLFWFNPLVWVIGRRIALEREIASDDAVVERTGAPADYATSLWRLAREMRMPEHAVVAPGALLTRKQISVRIEQLLDANRSRLHRSPAAAFGVATAAVLAVAFVATSSPAVELPAAGAQHPALAEATPSPAMTAASPVPHASPLARATSAAVAVAAAPPKPAPAPATARARAHTIVVLEMPSAPPVAQHAAAPSIPSAAPIPHIPATNAIPPQGLSDAIQQTVHDALASVPAAIAASSDPQRPSRGRLAGVRVSREMIASCVGCSMRDADLHGLDLHGLSINGVDLRGADLHGVNLSGTHLTGVSLSDANLTGADLRNAELNGVTLHDARLDGALLDGTRFIGISLRDVSLRGTALRSVIGNCVGCDFKHVDLHGQDLHGLALEGIDLSDADLHDANLSGMRLVGVDLSHANLNGADLTNTRFEGCDLGDTDLRGARTAGMVLHGSGLE
ncbi:MAG TPA: pentapeptide repeat-containing protein [Candidatus Limnocylindria bacterium]|jgi:uncharacterized protein YjbI with pentapeptide repeats/beta-lactamase regulating signal transducer with metallopeptidase domain|nr:pentapeptide repeat-containing protein [Candidatus Limnocylindria bacterium]